MARARAQKPKKEQTQQEGHLKKQAEGGTADPRQEILKLQETAGNQAVREQVGDELPEHVQEVMQSPGRPLDPTTRAEMEAKFSHNFADVRIHAGGPAQESARTVRAKAYTVGRDIVFSEGRFAPETQSGKGLLAHELAHVVQQLSSATGTAGIDLEGEAQAAGDQAVTNEAVTVQGSAGIVLQAAPEEEKKEKLPLAVVTSASAAVYSKPDATATPKDTLKQYAAVEEVVEKRKVKDAWWYKIRYKVDDTEKTGWSLGENFSEVADPGTFKLETPGSMGVGSPFESLREAVGEGKLEPNIARLINFMNIVVLPTSGLTLPDFVGKAFYHALVEAKGNFKQASLLMTAAVRAFKSSPGGKFPWVQAKVTATSGFDPATFRDKLWHFFWNTYERFDRTSSGWLDFKGIMYELKSRSEPIKKAFTLAPLSRDATEDVVFNRGGVMFAEWVMKNQKAVIKHHYSEMEKTLRAVIAGDKEMAKLPESDKDEIIRRLLGSDKIQTEMKKRSYADFAEYAARHIEAVLDAIKKIK